MKAAIDTEAATVYAGDCLALLRADENGYDYALGYGTRRLFPDESIDAVVTDPPYGINFMGKEWDGPSGMLGQMAHGHEKRGALAYGGTHSRGYADNDNAAFQAWCEQWAAECLRVLRPGGHMVAFGGSRTWHRLAAAVEDAGFEIRDSIAWLYGSGFPKSMDVSKAIDAAAGATREVVGYDAAKARPNKENFAKRNDRQPSSKAAEGWKDNGATITAPATDAAKQWQGWGTALKPAFEPIVVGRKPIAGTVASNVLAHGTGALNIDACRVAFASEADERESKDKNRHADFGTEAGGNAVYGDFSMVEPKNYEAPGRWPANVVLDGSQADELDRQSGVSTSRIGKPRGAAAGEGWGMTATGAEYDDAGGASRFFPTFRFQAKAPSSERPKVGEVQHPTVKPLELMRWLVRLVTPPAGVVLEPFAGSGTTVQAAVLEGFRCIAIEREAEYIPLIEQRLAKPMQQSLFDDIFEGVA